MDRQQEILRAIALSAHYLSDARYLSQRLPTVLAYLGRAVQVGRVYIFENRELDNGRFLTSHQLTWSVFWQHLHHRNPRLQNIAYHAHGFARWVEILQSGRPIYGNLSDFPLEEQLFLRNWFLRSLAIVPISYGGHWWGFIGFDDMSQERLWAPEEIEALTYVGQIMGATFENARLFHAEAERRREAEILSEVSRYLTQSLDPQDAFNQTIHTLLNYLSGDLIVTLTMLDETEQALRVLAQTSNFVENVQHNMGQRVLLAEAAVSRRVIEGKRPFTQSDLSTDPLPHKRGKTAVTAGQRSFLYLPLLLRSKSVGVLHIDVYNHPRHFSSTEISFCQGVANLMAAAIERQRLLDTERQQLHLARTLQQVGALLTTQLTLDEVYDQIFDLLAQVVNYDSVSVQIFDDSKEYLYMVAGRGFPNEPGVRKFIRSIASSTLGRFPEGVHVIVIPNTLTDPRWIRGKSVDHIHSWVGAVLRVKGQIIGILNVDSAQAGAFNEQTAVTVAAFANQAAIAIENARLYKSAQLSAHEVSILNEVALTTAVAVDIDELLHQTTRTLITHLYKDSFGFVLIDKAAGVARMHPSYYGISDACLQEPIPLHSSITGLVAQTGEAIIVPDIRQESHYWVFDERYRSGVVVPVKMDNEVIGAIAAESVHLDYFSPEDVHFFTALAGFVSLAIARTNLYQRLRDQSDRLAEEVIARTAELQSERDRTLTILESAGESIILTDIEGVVLYANQAAEQQSGYSQAELLGQNVRLLESGLTPKKSYDEMWQALQRGQKWSGEVVNRRKDGSLYDVSLTISPIFNSQQQVVNFVSIQADITRLKEVERLKTKFVTNVSHELRTPLTNIKTYVTLLERGRDESRQRYLEILHHETNRLTQLIQDLLDLSRLDTETAPDPEASCDIRQSILDYTDLFAARAEVRRVGLRAHVPPGLPWAGVEARHMGQLLTNLIGNALNYTPAGGSVLVQARYVAGPTEPQLLVQVIDTGQGIAPEDMAHLFNRFYRGQQAQESGAPGTGLGLAICYEIVKRYNGRLEVESELGVGSTFSVWLPAANVPEEAN
jgi:PAS domain S-box-containing protein